MFYKVKKVTPLPDYNLVILFENNVEKTYDIKPLFEQLPVFKALISTKGLFEQVQVDIGGYGISWNSELDLSCNELWNNGKLYNEV